MIRKSVFSCTKGGQWEYGVGPPWFNRIFTHIKSCIRRTIHLYIRQGEERFSPESLWSGNPLKRVWSKAQKFSKQNVSIPGPWDHFGWGLRPQALLRWGQTHVRQISSNNKYLLFSAQSMINLSSILSPLTSNLCFYCDTSLNNRNKIEEERGLSIKQD